MNREERSLEHTPTWAVSIVCLFFFLISSIINTVLHHLAEFLKRRKRKSLNRALGKIQTEMMVMGFISLLLTISEASISKICVPEAVANAFLPCKDPVEFVEPAVSSATQISGSKLNTTLSSDNIDEPHCEAKGMVSMVSREGVMQLKILISLLAVFHILYCVLTMCLGIVKMRRWKAWEEETQTLEYKIVNDPRKVQLTQQTSFGRRHLKLWNDHPLLLWPVCFIRQFSSSASKADYFTLRNGFIMANVAGGSNFNFRKFLSRALDDDFEQVVEIRFWIWIFSMLFIFFSGHGFYNYYWLTFIPLLIVLAVGTKLEVIITKMCVESCKNNSVIRGTFLVKPSDDLFWFGRPKWLLNLLQLVLIQNSFQLAFFIWTWYEYGLRSCFNRETYDIAIRVTMGVFVQFLCGYVTLPLYALVAQMGSGMKKAVFTERVANGLKNWHNSAKISLSSNRSTSTNSSPNSRPSDTTNTTIINMQNKHLPEYDHLPPLAAMSPPSSSEITEEAGQHNHNPRPATISISAPEITAEEANPNIVIEGTYDGEISFGSSWKMKLESGKGIRDITSIIEEDASTILTDFNE